MINPFFSCFMTYDFPYLFPCFGSSTHLHSIACFSISLLFLTAATSEDDLEKLSARVQAMLAAKIKSVDWCNKVVANVLAANVSVLHIPPQIIAIREICGLNSTGPIKFASVVLPAQRFPTGQPSSQPSYYIPPIKIGRRSYTTFALIIFIIIVIACLRCCLICIAFRHKKDAAESHLYDILVILNNDEEGIFENVRHEDIVFSRR